MIVDIDKIVVRDKRIRKDFGDIEELAADIKANGLINPPTINKGYVLLAGERRLRACKSLGWTQIEVHMLDTKDEAHDLEIEISENESRKDFTRSERMDLYTRRVEMQIASRVSPIGLDANKIEREVADDLGTSRTNMQREREILDHRDLLDPADFADWDEGKLSTNKAYQRIKAAQKQAEEAKARAERERDEAHDALEDAYRTNEILESENARLKSQPKPEPEVIEKEVVREVLPDDYNELKKRVPGLENENRRLLSENSGLRESNLKLNKEIEQKDELLGERERDNGANRDVEQLINNIYALLNRHGGKSRAFDQFYRVEETTRQECRKALTALGGFAQSLLAMTDETNRLGA